MTSRHSIAADIACPERRFKPPQGETNVISGGEKKKSTASVNTVIGPSTLRVTHRHFSPIRKRVVKNRSYRRQRCEHGIHFCLFLSPSRYLYLPICDDQKHLTTVDTAPPSPKAAGPAATRGGNKWTSIIVASHLPLIAKAISGRGSPIRHLQAHTKTNRTGGPAKASSCRRTPPFREPSNSAATDEPRYSESQQTQQLPTDPATPTDTKLEGV